MRGAALRRAAGVFLLLLPLFASADAWTARAQSRGDWSDPALIYETVEAIDAPYLASDPTGVTHLVWRETQRDTDAPSTQLEAIFYTNDLDGRMSQGRDIVAMSGGAVGPIVAGDANGLVHLIWRGSNNTLYHSLAGSASARSAQGWAAPVAVSTSNMNAHIMVDDERIAHVVYPGVESSGIYYTRYDAANDAWMSPVLVSLTASDEVSPDFTRLAIGPDGTLHLVWTEYLLPDGWPPTGIYYANSTDGGATWSRATELAGADNVQANVAVDSRGFVHVAWNRVVGIGGRYHQYSDDGGRSWSPVAEVVPAGQGGTEGPPQLAIDSADTVHMLTTFGGCAHHAQWVDGVWSEPVCISGRQAMASRYIEQPALSIANGNQLHAVFWDDRARLWHATMTADAPFVPPAAPAESAPAADSSGVSPNPTAALLPEASPTFDLGAAPPSVAQVGPARALLPAVAAAGALLGLALLIKLARSR